MMMNIENNVNEILSLYYLYGNADYIGEPVSQIEHMVQCAQLAEESEADDELILAAFFHDIGHLYEFAFPEQHLKHMEGVGIVDHENIGASYLKEKGFSEKITKLVGSHVAAKRYLTFKFPEYYEQLSDASKKTLVFQGGIMTAEEADNFERDDLSTMIITLRLWDEKAKEINKPLPDLNHYRKMMLKHLNQNNI
jgi:phosphonate degradation associated HDIG domain protein